MTYKYVKHETKLSNLLLVSMGETMRELDCEDLKKKNNQLMKLIKEHTVTLNEEGWEVKIINETLLSILEENEMLKRIQPITRKHWAWRCKNIWKKPY
jgi:hypothetical protein